MEDSPSDAFLTKQALAQTERTIQIQTVSDGAEALAFLRRELPYQDALRPDIILLDLNMPRKDGRELLAEIKEDPHLKCIPVIVLTTSAAEQDRSTAYALHANCYVVKPPDFKQFKAVIKALEDFWFNVVAFPGGEEAGPPDR